MTSQILYLGMVIAAFVTFGVTLFTVSTWQCLGRRAAAISAR